MQDVDISHTQDSYKELQDKLKTSQKRARGLLDIVLDTLDAKDIDTLCSRVLKLLTQTMDATATLCYIHTHDGFYLRGTQSNIDLSGIPHHFPDKVACRQDCLCFNPHELSTQCFTVVSSDEAAVESLTHKHNALPTTNAYSQDTPPDVVFLRDDKTGDITRLKVCNVPPFSSFVSVPVWYGERVIALLLVGYSAVHTFVKSDLDYLNGIARYLSIQLIGAITAAQAQRENRLIATSSKLRESMLHAQELGLSHVWKYANLAAKAIDAKLVFVCDEKSYCSLYAHSAKHQGEPTLFSGACKTCNTSLPAAEFFAQSPHYPAFSFDCPCFSAALGIPKHVSISTFCAQDSLGAVLKDQAIVGTGALVDFGLLGSSRCMCIFVRDETSTRLDSADLNFLSRLAHDIHDTTTNDQRHARDQHIAQALQTGMTNELQQVEGITAQGIYSSATQTATIGGDFYDLIRLPKCRACVIMGDVSGKGVEAASVSAAVKTALRAYAWQGLMPAVQVRLLNRFLLSFSRVETFATLFIGIIDLQKGVITYCSAGHPPAMLIRASTGTIEQLNVQSGAVGAFSEMSYTDGTTELFEGDILVLYTDGTTEARAQDGSFFGEDGLMDALLRERSQGIQGLPQRLLDRLDAFTSQHLQDDVAIVGLRFDDVHVKVCRDCLLD